ncbi:hypothetical protein [Nocardioides houyundeii]|uniref:hypothetical protein n=1 Tax=Nocardioides houyundeii TaxID=2045452 RepID=UPI000C75F955|nr:hypothetical protein [Nocardioides houyundeii]
MGWLLLALFALVYLAVGPWTFFLAAALLAVPRIRERVPRPRPTWRGAGIGVAALAVLALLVVLIPDGRLPIPSAGGSLVTPAYDGRQVSARPVAAEVPPQHPWLAANGTSSLHKDAWNTDAVQGPGPLGDRPGVETGSYGLEQCASLAFDSRGRMVGLCRDRKGPVLRVLDPEKLRPLATKRLPAGKDEGPEGHDVCGGSYFYLDNGDRAVVITADRKIQAIGTADADDEPDLTVDESWSLEDLVPADDCLVAALPDWTGRIWWSSQAGRVGVVDPVAGTVQVLELGEAVSNSFAVDETGGVFLVTDRALYRLAVDAAGAPVVTWRTEYDRGVERKAGQPSQGSGTTPTLVDGNLVAIADNAEPRMRVVFLDRGTGTEVCHSAVFDGGESATDTSLVSVGSGVVVENNHDYDSPLSTALGFGTSPGLARVDERDGQCRVVWTNDSVAPSAVPVVSWANGLLYTWTKRPNLWGVAAWYLTAIDVHSGHTAFSVRSGTGALHDNHHSGLVLGADGSAYVGTLGGLVRVRDYQRKSED